MARWSVSSRRALQLAPIAAAALLAACEPSPKDGFNIHFKLDESQGATCGRGATCSDFGMRCGARLLIRILDLETGVPIDSCEEIARADTLCALETEQATVFSNLRLHRMRISVAVWSPEVLRPIYGSRCPSQDIWDALGAPRADFHPQPAFAGAELFDVGGDRNEVWVPIRCPDANQLDQASCDGPSTTLVRAAVVDLATGVTISDEQASLLTVGVARPTRIPAFPKETQYQIDIGDIRRLERADGSPPSFATEFDGPMAGTLCAVVDDSSAQSTTTAACREVSDGSDPVELDGVLVSSSDLDKLVEIMDPPEFPEDGLVVGRVFDHMGGPLEGVTLTVPAAPETVVQYLNAEGTAFVGPPTAANGFFISRNAPFGSRWQAVSEDGRTALGMPRAGLVRDKVSPLLIRMTPTPSRDD